MSVFNTQSSSALNSVGLNGGSQSAQLPPVSTTALEPFSHYLDPKVDIRAALIAATDQVKISADTFHKMFDFLGILRGTEFAPTFEHSIRVGLLCLAIAEAEGLDAQALFLAGTMHDIGKGFVCPKVLNKVSGWTKEDADAMREHPSTGYLLLKDDFPFVAEIVVRHHRFQPDPYPAELPVMSQPWGKRSIERIEQLARVVALADCFDALHRKNSCFGVLDGDQIRAKMIEKNPDCKELVERLYNKGIFTTRIV